MTSDEELIARVRELAFVPGDEGWELLDTLARRLKDGTEKDYVTVHTSTGKPLAVTASDAQELEEDVLAMQACIQGLREGLERIANHPRLEFGADVEVMDLSTHDLGATIESMKSIARSLLHPEPQEDG